MKKIIFSGGNGRFGKVFKSIKKNKKLKFFYPSKQLMNIQKISSIEKFIKKTNAKYFIHAAALSRPMNIHNEDIIKSIKNNIIGTCNVVIACQKYSLKLIFFSTNYVYPGKKGNYKESDSVNPINNYAFSKLGGESAVRMYNNSLILRICMTEKPFVHKYAFHDIKTNFIFHEDVAKMIPKILETKGILNVGGKARSVYNFAKKFNKKIKKKSGIKTYPKNIYMNIDKLNKILQKKIN